MIKLAVFVSLSVLRGYATDSGLNWDITAAIASAFTYSKHSKKLGNNLRETVVLPEPLGPQIM
jgi:hypothetical protein